MKKEIENLILSVNRTIELTKYTTVLTVEEKQDVVINLEKCKESLREAKFYAGLADINLSAILGS